MAIIVNTPTQTRDEGSGIGMAVALILFAILVLLLFVYGLPFIRQSIGTPQITIPGKIDINLNQGR